MFKNLLLWVLVFIPAARASDTLWLTDMKKALKKAAQEKKDLLLNFTGSDWCIWCRRLHSEVFSQKVFKEEIPKYFVLVELDFPRAKPQSSNLQKQNREWLMKLGVQGFPTIFLTDSKGRPYAKTGYLPGGAENYVKHLKKLRELRVSRDKALLQAQKAKGAEKAKLLDKAIGSFDPAIILSSYKDLAQEIIKLDKGNKAGLKNKYSALFAIADVEKLKQQGKFKEAAAKADETFKKLKLSGQFAQDLHFAKAEALYMAGDKEGAKKSLLAALQAFPQGDKTLLIKTILKNLFNVEK